jgi:small neutral amino acid transporter SnatA (MarC family)
MVHLAVRTGPNILAALEIERQADRDPTVVRPSEFAVMVVFFKHGSSLLALWSAQLPDFLKAPGMQTESRI